jgi:ubiquitin carboxyl-terminal hydrolase 14
MNEEIEKQSQSLGRNALYEKHSLISRLPAYLSVQIIRFYYKEQGNVSWDMQNKFWLKKFPLSNQQINAKILKDVKFPMVFDVFEMCTPELQEKLKPARQANKVRLI